MQFKLKKLHKILSTYMKLKYAVKLNKTHLESTGNEYNCHSNVTVILVSILEYIKSIIFLTYLDWEKCTFSVDVKFKYIKWHYIIVYTQR